MYVSSLGGSAPLGDGLAERQLTRFTLYSGLNDLPNKERRRLIRISTTAANYPVADASLGMQSSYYYDFNPSPDADYNREAIYRSYCQFAVGLNAGFSPKGALKLFDTSESPDYQNVFYGQGNRPVYRGNEPVGPTRVTSGGKTVQDKRFWVCSKEGKDVGLEQEQEAGFKSMRVFFGASGGVCAITGAYAVDGDPVRRLTIDR